MNREQASYTRITFASIYYYYVFALRCIRHLSVVEWRVPSLCLCTRSIKCSGTNSTPFCIFVLFRTLWLCRNNGNRIAGRLWTLVVATVAAATHYLSFETRNKVILSSTLFLRPHNTPQCTMCPSTYFRSHRIRIRTMRMKTCGSGRKCVSSVCE